MVTPFTQFYTIHIRALFTASTRALKDNKNVKKEKEKAVAAYGSLA